MPDQSDVVKIEPHIDSYLKWKMTKHPPRKDSKVNKDSNRKMKVLK